MEHVIFKIFLDKAGAAAPTCPLMAKPLVYSFYSWKIKEKLWAIYMIISCYTKYYKDLIIFILCIYFVSPFYLAINGVIIFL